MTEEKVATGRLADQDIQWSEAAQPLRQILSESKLPVVVKLWTENQLRAHPGASSSDIHQPLVLYREVEGRKVYAKNVTSVDVLTGAICREDPVVVMPAGYKGWFRLIDDLDKPMSTISHVARIMPVRFLCCKPTIGFFEIEKPSRTGATDGLFEQVEAKPGVFMVKNIYEDFVRYTEKKKIVKRIMRCLVCVSEIGVEIMFPFETEGTFYLVETRKGASKKLNADKVGYVYNIGDMIEAGLGKNVIISLLCGKPPSKPCGFTNVLKICDLIKDHTVIACTYSDSPRMLELPVAPNPLFVKALNVSNVPGGSTNSTYATVLKFLSKNAEEYTHDLKVRYNYSVESVEQEHPKKDNS
ncbi:hypothetical protein FSP39_013866 [Pinctada imbricata]|uniref:CABIT domain-containing protein n=1 Tax=Pinctada imbricata TaxID=66713 RepID=A0AA89C1F7_PINIB|nr:hypothetical protein FSP39_013866 [Pinctada imbricata]